MKRLFITVFTICIAFFPTLGQDSEYEFAEEVFKTEYKKAKYDRFKGTVERIAANTFRFGDKVLDVQTDDSSLLVIFSKGIFHPEIIYGKQIVRALSSSQLDTTAAEKKILYNLSRNDTVMIRELEELKELNPSPKTKRFVFWLYNQGMLNPTECYFEIYNKKGAKNMTILEFVRGASVTFYHKGTIII